MGSSILISSGINVIPPFTATVCDFYGNNCSILGTGNSFPVVFTLPPQFNTAPVVQLTLVDSVGCTISEIIYCGFSKPKQFQNLDYFYFMYGDIFEFQ